MFVDWMLWKIFRSESEEVTGGRRKARNAEIHDFHCLQNVIYVCVCVCGEIKEVELDKACGICGG